MNRTCSLALGILVATALPSCGGHLGDLTGPVGPIRKPIPPPSAAPQAGLVAMAAGNGEVRIDYVLPNAGFEAALFASTDPLTVFGGAPIATVLTGSSLTMTAGTHPALVQNGTALFAGYAIRAVGSTDWTPVGTVIRAKPSVRTIYVDPAGPSTGDGTTPATAFPLLDNALLVGAVYASVFGDVNVHVREGTYTTRAFDPASQEGGEFTLGPGVHAYGGFQPGFALADRRATGGGTILNGGPTTSIVDIISGGAVHVLDGFVVDGRLDVAGVIPTTEGIDVVESDCELRSVSAIRCVDNGLRIKQQTDFTNRRVVAIVGCDISRNGNDGVGVAGVFNIVLDRSTFDANGGSGVDVNDLLALEGAAAGVRAFGCRFFGNSLEGLGMDLNTVTTANPTPGGRYDIDLSGCLFERNGTVGLRIDEDHDLFPAWRTATTIRDCIARANRTNGITFDADDQGEYLLDRVRCTANGSDGFLLTSEPDDVATTEDDLAPGFVLVTNSYFGGNLGAGVRAAQGDKVVLASHCAFAGNVGGGIVSELSFLGLTNTRRISTVTSSVFWRQPTPFTNTVDTACWVDNVTNPFNFAPEQFAVASTHTNGVLSLSAASQFAAGQFAVVGDDRVGRAVTGSSGASITVNPAPTTFVAPDAVFGYADATVTDDLRLITNSAAIGTALVAVGAQARDPGPSGSIGGGEPGNFDPFAPAVLRLLAMDPPVASGVTTTTAVVLTFDRLLDPASVTANTVLVRGVANVGLTASGNQLTVSPPPSGWTGSNVLELNIGLLAQDGTPFGVGLVIPVLTR